MAGAPETILDMLRELPRLYPIFTVTFLGLFGLCMGSFANVLIYRMPRYCLSIIRPGSRCPVCETPLAWYDNIPVLAWAIWLGRKCRHCKAPIPARYPIVELLVGGWFAALAYVVLVSPYDGSSLMQSIFDWHDFGDRALLLADAPLADWQHWLTWLVWADFGTVLVVASFIDAEMRIIPDRLSVGSGIAAFLVIPLVPNLHFAGVPPALLVDPLVWLTDSPIWLRVLFTSGVLAAISALFMFLLGLLGYVVAPAAAKQHGGGMGMGDLKLIIPIAVLLGWPKLALAFVFACFAGAAFGMPRMIQKWIWGKEVDSAVSFGPFLAIGAGAAMLFAGPVFAWIVEWYRGMLGM